MEGAAGMDSKAKEIANAERENFFIGRDYCEKVEWKNDEYKSGRIRMRKGENVRPMGMPVLRSNASHR